MRDLARSTTRISPALPLLHFFKLHSASSPVAPRCVLHRGLPFSELASQLWDVVSKAHLHGNKLAQNLERHLSVFPRLPRVTFKLALPLQYPFARLEGELALEVLLASRGWQQGVQKDFILHSSAPLLCSAAWLSLGFEKLVARRGSSFASSDSDRIVGPPNHCPRPPSCDSSFYQGDHSPAQAAACPPA